MRVLIAGLGLIGARHLSHALKLPGIEVVGVIDPVVTSELPQWDAIEDVDVEADAIVIATPSHLHADHAEVAAARGWHMMIEKPVAHSLEAADRIIAAADRFGVQALVGHHRRHHARVAGLKTMLDAGEIGTPVLASLIWSMKKPDDYFVGNWRAGADGSPVMINLVHEVDLLRHFFGEVTVVQGIGANALRGAARVESGVAMLGFESGVSASIAFADCALSPWGFEAGTGENPNIGTTSQDYLRITGSQGALSFPSLTLWSGAKDWSEPAMATQRDVASNVPLDTQLLHFKDVVEGRAAPIVSALEGRKSLEVTLRIEREVAPVEAAA